MRQLTKHFNLSEFTNAQGLWLPEGLDESVGYDRYTELANRLEDLRFHLGQSPIRITSAYRTLDEQRSINPDAMRSMHVKGLAVDCTVEGFSPSEVYIMCTADWRGGLGLYTTHVHLDCRDMIGQGKARWKKL